MDLGLEGTRVIVTGGAGGIGSAIVRSFASEGATVAIHHRTSADAAEALARSTGGFAVRGDLTNETDVHAVFEQSIQSLGGLDVCVANAGWYPTDDVPVWDLGVDRWREVIDRNLTIAFLTARAFLSVAKESQRGVLIFTGSTAGIFGEAGHADYAAAKAPLTSGLLLSLKNECARIGDEVRVHAVAPGWTATPRRVEAGIDPDHVARATATMARKQIATPQDVADQVVFLASNRAAHLSGQIIAVAGGMEGRVVP